MSRVRVWNAEEFFQRPPREVVEQSNQLSAAMCKLLFGKHPGAQMLSLVELSAKWIHNHQEGEHRKQAYDLFRMALDECVTKGVFDA